MRVDAGLPQGPEPSKCFNVDIITVIFLHGRVDDFE